MERIGFIGVYDKTDLLINIAKILTMLDKKVLLIDSTVTQKAKYIVPTITPTTSYVTNFEEIDVAVGFKNITQIKEYLGIEELTYDIALIDVDTSKELEEFELANAKKNFFVTSFDVYSLKKGLEIFAGLNHNLNLIKVLFSIEMLREEEEYLDFLASDYKSIWSDYKIYFQMENGDLSAMMENQRTQRIKFKKLSAQYKDGLLVIVQQILENASEGSIRKIIKNIEKGV